MYYLIQEFKTDVAREEALLNVTRNNYSSSGKGKSSNCYFTSTNKEEEIPSASDWIGVNSG